MRKTTHHRFHVSISSTINILNSLLLASLVYSRIQYGITAWATANKTSQEIIRVRLNKILRIILFRNLYTITSQMYKELQVLKVDSIN